MVNYCVVLIFATLFIRSICVANYTATSNQKRRRQASAVKMCKSPTISKVVLILGHAWFVYQIQTVIVSG